MSNAFLRSPRVDIHSKLVHVVTTENRKPGQSASSLAIMLEAIDRAEKHPGGLFEGLCESFCGPLAIKMLRAAGFPITDDLRRRVR